MVIFVIPILTWIVYVSIWAVLHTITYATSDSYRRYWDDRSRG
jgi:hypothetical protein